MIPSTTASYSLAGGVSNGSVSNPTEIVGIKMVTSPDILSTERSCIAMENALLHCDDVDMKLIDLIYWKQSYTVIGAGITIGLEKSSTYQCVNAILGRIAIEMGLVNI